MKHNDEFVRLVSSVMVNWNIIKRGESLILKCAHHKDVFLSKAYYGLLHAGNQDFFRTTGKHRQQDNLARGSGEGLHKGSNDEKSLHCVRTFDFRKMFKIVDKDRTGKISFKNFLDTVVLFARGIVNLWCY